MASKGLLAALFIVVVVAAGFAGWFLRSLAGAHPEESGADASPRAGRPPDLYLSLPDVPAGPIRSPAPSTLFERLGGASPADAALEETAYRYDEFIPVTEYRWNCQPAIYYHSPQLFDTIETCQRRFEIDHPYAQFTDEQLAQIAPTDGEAAYILALRQLIDLPEGKRRDVEAGLNNVMSAIIRGGGRQAFSLLLDPAVFSVYGNSDSFMLWSYVGRDLGLLDDAQIDRLARAEAEFGRDRMQSIIEEAEQIAELLRQQRLIVMGTEFQEDNTTQ